ncbi:MAG: class I SAM-dependent methyltransferase [Myxococcales bacterium]|nr:class I SAM-dependent methyltransferase [Myxococcales bacterium]
MSSHSHPERHVDAGNFASWNDEMARAHDPDLYHTASPLPVRLLERQRVRKVVSLLAATDQHTVLEVGCGAGNVLAQVRGRRTGIDLSPFLLEKARSRLGADATILEMNAESLTFPDESFDRVYCSEVLEHVLDPGRVIAEIRRVLKPTGVAVVSVPNEGLINAIKGRVFSVPGATWLLERRSGYAMPQHMEDEWHLHEMDEPSLRALVVPHFHVETLAGVPHGRVPIRYVARLRPRGR